MPAPVSITAPNSPKKRGGKTSYGGSRPSPSGGHTAPAQSTPTVTTVSPSGTVTSSGPRAYAATRATKQARRQSRHVQTALKMVERDARRRKLQALPPKVLQTVKQVNPSASVKDARGLAKMVNAAPNARISSVLGKPTLGTPTLKSVIAQPAKLNTKGPVSTPQVRKVEKKLKVAKQEVAHSSGGVVGDFTPGQTTFINTLSKKSGLSPKVVGAWVAAEAGFGNGGSAAQNEARGYHNWLNIGPFSTDPRLNNPKTAAGYVNEMIHGQGSGANIASISRAAGKPVAQQVSAIANSGWVDGVGNGSPGSITYGNSIRALLSSVGEKPGNPKAKQDLKTALTAAKKFGLNVDGKIDPKVGKPSPQVVSRFKAILTTAKQIDSAQLPYVWGGGHVSGTIPGPDAISGYDCSGAVSKVLQAAGVKMPGGVVSGDMGAYLKPGPGAVTVFYSPEHTFMRIGNRYWGTSHANAGGGAGFIPTSYEQGEAMSGKYSVGHVAGLGQKVALQLGVKGSFPGMSVSGTTGTINPGAGAIVGSPGISSSPIMPQQRKTKPSGAEILAKLKKYGVGTDSTTASTTSDSTLTELEKRYGVGV